MSDFIDETAEISGKADALLINIGTPHRDTYDVFAEAMRIAEKRRIPAVLDLVGYGFTDFRRKLGDWLLDRFVFSIVKGNSGEIAALAGAGHGPKGVSSDGNIYGIAPLTEELARRYRCTVFSTGERDFLSDGTRTVCFHGGDPMIGRLSGMGCALGSAAALFAAVSEPFDAAFAALSSFRAAGESAARSAKGPGSFYMNFMDSLALLHCENTEYWRKLTDGQ